MPVSAEGEKRDRGRVNVRGVGHAECGAVARIPAPARAHSIQEHPDPHADPLAETRFWAETAVLGLLKSDQAECCRNHPARSARNPAPAVLCWIEFHTVVNGLELPAPEPICLSSSFIQ